MICIKPQGLSPRTNDLQGRGAGGAVAESGALVGNQNGNAEDMENGEVGKDAKSQSDG